MICAILITISFLLLWFLGYICSYIFLCFVFKYVIGNNTPPELIPLIDADRKTICLVSLGSWLTIILVTIACIVLLIGISVNRLKISVIYSKLTQILWDKFLSLLKRIEPKM